MKKLGFEVAGMVLKELFRRILEEHDETERYNHHRSSRQHSIFRTAVWSRPWNGVPRPA